MGTFGTGPFDSDGALDFLDRLADLSADQRREVLERLFLAVRNGLEQPERTVFPDEVVAAAAVVAASLSDGAGIRQLIEKGCDASSILVAGADHELAASALEGLLRAAGHAGPWHHGWASPNDEIRARQTSDQLAAILVRGRRPQNE